ncbi:MmpS family transport accessory protein [Actinoplanes sp. NPDC023714]|uniref:MmpS family transport accessory protein n=1 Tax=Actinoplanes sp. NPDC023714 TaxID=3154322 RepID=UPI0033DCA376
MATPDGDSAYQNATPSDLAARPWTPPAKRPTVVAALLTALLVAALLCAGLVVVGRSTPADPLPPPQREVPIAPVAPDEPAAPIQVIYEVTASGSGNVGSVSFTDQDGDIIRRGGIPLPWRTTFTADRRSPLVLHAQRKAGGDAGPVSCSITVDGKVIANTTEQGRYAAPQCSG